jgi:GAF domain-containing protein
MNYVLTIALLLAILLFVSSIYRLERARADYKSSTGRPENLQFILKDMLRTVQHEGHWDRVEFMRAEVRQALRTLDNMRHDHSNNGLRASKQRLEAEK